MIIRTNPPGALVYVDDNEVGLTPVAVSPIYYGSRKIRLVKDGCETLTLIQSVPAPWYEVPPLDFFAENLVPGKIRDVRTFDYQLQPQGVVPSDQLLTRAENLRHGTQTMPGIATPAYRINATPGRVVAPAPGSATGQPIGGQPSYQLPAGAPGPAAPLGPGYAPPPGTLPAMPPPVGPVYTPPPGTAPIGPQPGGSIYQPPSTPAAAPAGPSDVGSQPYHPLP